MNYIFAGDRDIAVWVLKELINASLPPKALMVSEPHKASHDKDLINMANLPRDKVVVGKEFLANDYIEWMNSLNLDYILCVHFPYIVPKLILEIPKHGVINLHPAFLPYNRGWHTPSWAILENTPIGATLHFMSEGLDLGDIIHQKKIDVKPEDTADSLYKRLKSIEIEVFREALPKLIYFSYDRKSQVSTEGTAHKREELFSSEIQKINLSETYKAEDLLRKLRALTTNNIDEAPCFKLNGKCYRVQINIMPDE